MTAGYGLIKTASHGFDSGTL